MKLISNTYAKLVPIICGVVGTIALVEASTGVMQRMLKYAVRFLMTIFKIKLYF